MGFHSVDIPIFLTYRSSRNITSSPEAPFSPFYSMPTAKNAMDVIFFNFICMESYCMYSFVCLLWIHHFNDCILFLCIAILQFTWLIYIVVHSPFPQFFAFIKNTVISMQQINFFPHKINPFMWKLLRLLTNITKLRFRKVTSILHSHYSIEDFPFLRCGPKLNTKPQVYSN